MHLLSSGVTDIRSVRPYQLQLLDIERIERLALLFGIGFYVYRERNCGVNVMISIGCIIIDKELPVGIVLDSIRDNLCCGIIARNHPSGSVDYGTREEKPMHCVTISACRLRLTLGIVIVLLVVEFFLYLVIHLFVGYMVVQEVLQKSEEFLSQTLT